MTEQISAGEELLGTALLATALVPPQRSRVADMAYQRKAISPGGRAADDSPVGTPGGKENWVDRAGGLPKYIRMVAHALIKEHGFTTSRAIATAVNQMKKWAAGASDPKVKASAAAALAEWYAKRGAARAEKRDAAYLEFKRDRRVFSQAGVDRYHKPIGSLIGGFRFMNDHQMDAEFGDRKRRYTYAPGEHATLHESGDIVLSSGGTGGVYEHDVYASMNDDHAAEMVTALTHVINEASTWDPGHDDEDRQIDDSTGIVGGETEISNGTRIGFDAAGDVVVVFPTPEGSGRGEDEHLIDNEEARHLTNALHTLVQEARKAPPPPDDEIDEDPDGGYDIEDEAGEKSFEPVELKFRFPKDSTPGAERGPRWDETKSLIRKVRAPGGEWARIEVKVRKRAPGEVPGVRYVRTQEGADFYGVAIGKPIPKGGKRHRGVPQGRQPGLHQEDRRDEVSAAPYQHGMMPPGEELPSGHLTDHVDEAVADLMDSGWAPINHMLRTDYEDPYWQETVDAIDAGMAPSERPTQAFRAITNPQKVFGPSWSDETSMEGMEFEDPGYSPVSTDYQATAGGAKVVARITSPAGTPMLGVTETDILLDRGGKYRVTQDHGYSPDGVRQLDIEIVTAGAPEQDEEPERPGYETGISQPGKTPAKKAVPAKKAPASAVAKPGASDPAAPPAKAVKKTTVKPTTLDADVIATASKPGVFDVSTNEGSDQVLEAIAKQHGFDAPVTQVSAADIDAAIAEGQPEMYRGVRSAAADQQFRTGEYFGGIGHDGHGMYAQYRPADFDARREARAHWLGSGEADSDESGLDEHDIAAIDRAEAQIKPKLRTVAEGYAGPDGVVSRMTLRPGTEVRDMGTEVWPAQSAFLADLDTRIKTSSGDEQAKLKVQREVYSDIGRFAAASGVEAYYGSVPGEIVILNRGALLVESADAPEKPAAPVKQVAPAKKATPPKVTKNAAVPTFTMPASAKPADVAALRTELHMDDPAGHMMHRAQYAVDDGYGSDKAQKLAAKIGPVAARRVAREADVENAFARFLQIQQPEDPSLGEYDDLPPLTEDQITEGRTKAAEALKRQLAGKKVAVRVQPEALAAILRDGRMKTTFESGRSGSLGGSKESYRESRRVAEEILFGISKDAPASERPIYGYVATNGVGPTEEHGFLSQYGRVQVVLKDSVRGRTTASVGDSIDDDTLPSPIDDPSWESFNGGAHLSSGYGQAPGIYFTEAHIHGGVTTDDIDEVVFETAPSPDLVKQLKSAGISYRLASEETTQTDTGGQITREEAGRRMFGDEEYERRAAKKAVKKAPVKKAAPAKAAPPAKRGSTPRAKPDIPALAEKVKGIKTEDGVRQLLQDSKLTIPQLRELGDAIGGPAANQRGAKQQIIDKIAASTGGLVDRPASIFAGTWNRDVNLGVGTTARERAPDTPATIDAEEAARRAAILAAPLAENRPMRGETGIGVFSADPEVARRSAAALDAVSSSAAKLVRLQTELETLQGRLGMAGDKRKGKIASPAESRLRGKISEKRREISAARRAAEETNAG